MHSYKAIFLILGFIFFINALIMNGVSIIAGKFPDALMAIALTIMCFCLAYLTPHFAVKDERAQKIRERAVYMSYFWGIGFAIILMIIFNPVSAIDLAAFHVLSLFMALYISTVFLTMVYYAKRY